MPHPAPPRPRTLRVLLLLALALLALVVTPAQGRARHPRRARAGVARPAPAAPRITVTVEPETGALVPAPAGLVLPGGAERTGLLRSAEGLREVRLPGGAVMVDLQGRFQEYAVVLVGPDGCPRLGCVDDAPALGAWLLGTPLRPAPPTLEVR